MSDSEQIDDQPTEPIPSPDASSTVVAGEPSSAADASPKASGPVPEIDPVNPAAAMLSRIFSGATSSAGIVGIVLFFLPWQRWSCNDVTLISQSGFELSSGRVRANDNFEQEFQEKLQKQLGEDSKSKPNPRRESSSRMEESRRARRKLEKEGAGSFVFLYLYLAGMVLVTGFGLIGMLARRPVNTLPIFLGSVLAMFAVIGCLTSDFPIERAMVSKANEPEYKMIDSLMYLERTVYYDAAMITGFVAMALIALQSLVVQVIQRRPAGEPTRADSS